MFSNVSPLWRKRLQFIVVAWALLLVALVFFAGGASVREQAGADEGRRAADEAVGVAASGLAGSAFEFAVGPPVARDCDLTPVRGGIEYVRSFQVATDEPEVAYAQAGAALAERFGAEPPGNGDHWRHTTAEFVSLRLDVDSQMPGLRGSASTGCRPDGPAIGALLPAERPGWIELAQTHPGLDASDAEISGYGRLPCADGGEVETWWWDVGGDEAVPYSRDGCV